MPKLTDEQREQRRQKLQEEALETVAARGQFNFRLDGQDIKRLYQMAGKHHKPVSTMVREWVLERLTVEETSAHQAPLWAQELAQRVSHTESYLLLALTALDMPGQGNKVLRDKLLNHVRAHGNIEMDDELRNLLAQ
jgi:hypothetical protein